MLVVQGGIAVSDMLHNLGGYWLRVAFRAGPDLGPYVGDWHVHGSTMTIAADGTGSTSWNAGPCDNGGGMCLGKAALKVVAESSGLVATVVDVHVVDPSGTRRTDQRDWPDTPKSGSRFSLRVVAPGVLTSAVVTGPQYIGNPYWCSDTAAQTWQTQCN